MGEKGEVTLAANDVATMATVIRQWLTARAPDSRACREGAWLAGHLGFDGFSYLVVRPGTVETELLRHWSTASPRWRAQYRKHSYHLVDPRITRTQGRTVPLRWAHEATHADPRARAFAFAAHAHGIDGGVVMSMHQPGGERAILAWEWHSAPGTDTRTRELRADLATLTLLACFVHEEVSKAHAPVEDAPRTLPASLTPRERECLSLASRGMTSADIGAKVGIAVRTVNFHMGNLVHKLGALNRAEAIARGVSLNLVPRYR